MKSVTAALIIKDSFVLVAQRSLTDKMPGKWEFPGGKIEPGETPQECLQREIEEELGIIVEVGDYFGESIYDYEFGSIKLIAYWAKWVNGDIKLTFHNDYKWVSFQELDKFDFCPADIAFVNKLISTEVT